MPAKLLDITSENRTWRGMWVWFMTNIFSLYGLVDLNEVQDPV